MRTNNYLIYSLFYISYAYQGNIKLKATEMRTYISICYNHIICCYKNQLDKRERKKSLNTLSNIPSQLNINYV